MAVGSLQWAVSRALRIANLILPTLPQKTVSSHPQMLTAKQHYKETFNLAWPLILTQVGHIITGMVDTVFLGQIGVAEQAAGIFANNIYILLLVFGIGLSYATTPLVTAANEKNDL